MAKIAAKSSKATTLRSIVVCAQLKLLLRLKLRFYYYWVVPYYYYWNAAPLENVWRPTITTDEDTVSQGGGCQIQGPQNPLDRATVFKIEANKKSVVQCNASIDID